MLRAIALALRDGKTLEVARSPLERAGPDQNRTRARSNRHSVTATAIAKDFRDRVGIRIFISVSNIRTAEEKDTSAGR